MIVDWYEFCIDLGEYAYADNSLLLAVHAAVELQDEEGNPIQEETTWADGPEFPGRSWATYLNYDVQDCDEEEGGVGGRVTAPALPVRNRSPANVAGLPSSVDVLSREPCSRDPHRYLKRITGRLCRLSLVTICM